MRFMSRLALTACAVLAPALSAQSTGLAASAVITAPTYAIYSIGGGKTEKRVEPVTDAVQSLDPAAAAKMMEESTAQGGVLTTSADVMA